MIRSFKQIIVLISVGLVAACGLMGCSAKHKKVEQAVKPQPGAPAFVHTVRWPGESLSIIAKWYTGDLKNWKVIAEANPETNPKTIKIGDQIRIPESLLKNKEPMPRSLVSPYNRKTKTTRVAPSDSEDSRASQKLPSREMKEPDTSSVESADSRPSANPEPEKLELFGPKE